MPTKNTCSKPDHRFLRFLPWLILVGGLALTCLLVSQIHQHEIEMERSEFDLRVNELVSGLQNRMTANAQILRGVSGLFMSSHDITRDEFRRYVEGLRVPENYPGIQGIGYAAVVPAREKTRHIAAIRAQGFPDYEIRPPGARDPYSSVVYVEPFDWRNRRAFGFDMLTDPVRSAAAARACDENRAAMSDRVTLRQETDKDVQAGVIIFVPVYRSGAHLDTVEQRRMALRGWAYSALRIKNVMRTYLESEYPDLSKRLSINIYSKGAITYDALMYESHPAIAGPPGHLNAVRRLTSGGTNWTIQVKPLSAYLADEQAIQTSTTVMAAGCLLTLVLAFAALSLIRTHLRVTAALDEAGRANRDLAERTRELAESEGRVRMKLDALLSPEGNMESLDLADIIDCREIQRVMESFFRLTTIAVALLNLKGKVLVATGWQDICTKFHRVNPESAQNCMESDTILSQGVEAGTYRTYLCKNGMIDVVTPITVGGKHVGNLFLGQFLFDEEPPNPEKFQQQARRFGFDEAAYLAAYERVPRWSREKVDVVMHFYMQFAEMISRLNHGNIQLARSLTEQKQIEEALVFTKGQAEEANRAKSIFLANMSHEIRTPLNAILGFAQVLGRDPGLNATQLDSLTTIQRSGEHLLTLINEILDMAKIEAGRMINHVAPFDIHRLISETEEFFRQRTHDRGLAWTVDSSVTTRFVAGDEMKLRQVLINLVGNAVKFTSAGKVTLTVVTVDDGCIRFKVTDTGVGIAPEEMARLFEPFSQTASGRQVQGGTGLGLALSTQYVRIMGGELTAQSTPGQGSGFSFTLPLRSADYTETTTDQAKVPVIGLEPGQPVCRILIVDDQQDNRAPLRALLAMLNPEPPVLDLREAADGREALEVWEQWQPHVVFMDMRMPVLSGEEATRKIKTLMAARPDAVQSVVVALTASAYEENRSNFLACGCDDFARKPFLAEELFTILERRAGLRFVRASEQQVPEEALTHEEVATRLASCPSGWLTKLKDAVALGDFGKISELLEQIGDSDAALCAALAKWAYNYDLDAFSQVLGISHSET